MNMSEFTSKEYMTAVLVGCEEFPRTATVGDKEYKVCSASVYNEISRNQLLENIISKLYDEGLIDDEKLIELGVTQEEIDTFCYDTSILDERK